MSYVYQTSTYPSNSFWGTSYWKRLACEEIAQRHPKGLPDITWYKHNPWEVLAQNHFVVSSTKVVKFTKQGTLLKHNISASLKKPRPLAQQLYMLFNMSVVQYVLYMSVQHVQEHSVPKLAWSIITPHLILTWLFKKKSTLLRPSSVMTDKQEDSTFLLAESPGQKGMLNIVKKNWLNEHN